MNNMLIDANALFTVILYILGYILLIVLIVLAIKAVKTIGKINTLVDDVQEKSNKINGVFDFVDSATDLVNGFTDKIVSGVAGFITNLFEKKHKGEDNNEKSISFISRGF